jgi:NAD(P)-dependent dehydrogenase (short-subunit alcohol dehydrogenase family)
MSRDVALITGGTSGIGFGIAKTLAANFDLALSFGGNLDKAQNAKQELQKLFPEARVEIFQKPLAQYADAAELYNQVKETFLEAPLVLVNSAGKLRDQLFLGSKFQDHVDHINEHLMIPMALCHLALKAMSTAKFGRIINLSSISAQFAKRGQTNYAAAKAGIEGFTKTLALEVAHRGVTVNAIAPGLIETPMTLDFVKKIEAEGGSIRSRIPAGRVGKPEEVGNLVRFLCSQEAAYMTGGVFTIDGGRSLGDPQS